MNAKSNTPIRVLIADDHRLVAEALEAVLSSEARIESSGSGPFRGLRAVSIRSR